MRSKQFWFINTAQSNGLQSEMEWRWLHWYSISMFQLAQSCGNSKQENCNRCNKASKLTEEWRQQAKMTRVCKSAEHWWAQNAMKQRNPDSASFLPILRWQYCQNIRADLRRFDFKILKQWRPAVYDGPRHQQIPLLERQTIDTVIPPCHFIHTVWPPDLSIF
jgi:hypothetical protein